MHKHLPESEHVLIPILREWDGKLGRQVRISSKSAFVNRKDGTFFSVDCLAT